MPPFSSFYLWFNIFKKQFNTRIKPIRSGNGTEFVNQKFNDFCKNFGINQQLTVPYNLQSNGPTERLSDASMYSAKAMLNVAKLSHQFQEDATSTQQIIYIIFFPHKGINGKIPFEIIFKIQSRLFKSTCFLEVNFFLFCSKISWRKVR